MSGGQVLNTCEVDNYLGLPGINGFDLGMQFQRDMRTDSVRRFVEADVTGIKNLPDCKGSDVGWGYGKGGSLLQPVRSTKAFLAPVEKTAGWQRYFLLCDRDGAFAKKKVTAVIGGGDVAVEDAIFLADLCEKVLPDPPQGQPARRQRACRKKLFTLLNVELVWNAARGNHGEAFKTGAAALIHRQKKSALLQRTESLLRSDSAGVREFQEPCKTDEAGYICAERIAAETAGILQSAMCGSKHAQIDGGCRRGQTWSTQCRNISRHGKNSVQRETAGRRSS